MTVGHAQPAEGTNPVATEPPEQDGPAVPADRSADRRDSDTDTDGGEPNFSELLSQQLGGTRGLIESGVPVVVFVIVNIVWSLTPALVGAVATAVVIAGWRLARRETIRHAVNGLFGVLVGAVIAWRTGEAKDFHLTHIAAAAVYGVVLVGSVAFRRPAIGYVWAMVAAGGRHEWREQPQLVRTFRWLTLVWAAMFLSRAVVLGSLHLADQDDALGIMRIVMGMPFYLGALALTVWAVRRTTKDVQPADG